MIDENHRLVGGAEIRDQARALILIQRDALVFMVGELAIKFHRMLRNRQQPVLLRGHGHAGGGMGVDDEAQIVPGGMDRGMDGEARLVDGFRALPVLVHDVAVKVDLHQVRRPHILKQHAVLVDQEMIFRSRSRALI